MQTRPIGIIALILFAFFSAAPSSAAETQATFLFYLASDAEGLYGQTAQFYPAIRSAVDRTSNPAAEHFHAIILHDPYTPELQPKLEIYKNGLLSKEVSKTFEKLDMGNPSSIQILFSALRQLNLKSEKIFLIIDGHGTAWNGFAFDTDMGERLKNPTHLSVRGTVEQLKVELRGEKLEAVIFNSCLMGSLEVLYEFSTVARYAVASAFPISLVDPNFAQRQTERILNHPDLAVQSALDYNEYLASNPNLDYFRKIRNESFDTDSFLLSLLKSETKSFSVSLDKIRLISDRTSSLLALLEVYLEDHEIDLFSPNRLLPPSFVSNEIPDTLLDLRKMLRFIEEKTQDGHPALSQRAATLLSILDQAILAPELSDSERTLSLFFLSPQLMNFTSLSDTVYSTKKATKTRVLQEELSFNKDTSWIDFQDRYWVSKNEKRSKRVNFSEQTFLEDIIK